MAYSTQVTLYTASEERDVLGQPIDNPQVWRTVWCEATHSGGSRRTYAGRIVNEHQVVLTTHWRDGIEQCRFAEFDGSRRIIQAIAPEGRKRKVHIVVDYDGYSYGE